MIFSNAGEIWTIFYTWKGYLRMSIAELPAMKSGAHVYQAHNLENYAEMCPGIPKCHYSNVPPPPWTNKMFREALKAQEDLRMLPGCRMLPIERQEDGEPVRMKQLRFQD